MYAGEPWTFCSIETRRSCSRTFLITTEGPFPRKTDNETMGKSLLNRTDTGRKRRGDDPISRSPVLDISRVFTVPRPCRRYRRSIRSRDAIPITTDRKITRNARRFREEKRNWNGIYEIIGSTRTRLPERYERVLEFENATSVHSLFANVLRFQLAL